VLTHLSLGWIGMTMTTRSTRRSAPNVA
jgi:hypothetical protein